MKWRDSYGYDQTPPFSRVLRTVYGAIVAEGPPNFKITHGLLSQHSAHGNHGNHGNSGDHGNSGNHARVNHGNRGNTGNSGNSGNQGSNHAHPDNNVSNSNTTMNNGGFNNTGYNHTSHGSGQGGGNQVGNNHYSYVTQMVVYTNTELRRMPISSSNNLSHCSLYLGQARSLLLLSVFFDTGASLTTGFLLTHKGIMDKNPKTVHSYEEFNGLNPFNPIKLTGAISDTADYDVSKHGIFSGGSVFHTIP